jgi:ATP-binding cassette, subfamily B, bacterial
MKLLLNYLKNFRGLIMLALLLASINQVFSLIDPLFFKMIVDNYLVDRTGRAIYDKFTTSEFLIGVGGLIGLSIGAAMVSRIAKNFQDYFVNVIVQKLGTQIYTDGLRQSLDMPYQVFEDQRSGETLGKLQKVRTDVEKLISAFVNILFTTIIGVTFVMIYAFTVHWLVPIVYFAAVPVLGMLSSRLSKRIKTMQQKIVKETTSLAGATTETLRNIELVKSLGLKKQETERLNTVTEKILGLELKKVRYIRSLSFIQGTVVNFLRNCILFLLIWLIFREQLSLGELFTLQIYSFFIFGPLQEIGTFFNTYREAEVSLANFEEILNTPKEPRPVSPVHIGEIRSLRFDRVAFQHMSAKTKAVDNISFETGVGETIAFAGPSGSGKTTLVKLLVGLYHPENGQILFNGTASSEISLDELRSQIGFVTQDTQLFAGTIRENLLFVNPSASDEECIDVLGKAACHNLMSRADKGLDTLIGEGGVKISGGEKQRLSIARALLRKPRLLVFDEATSALDSITEEEISKTIRSISESKKHITILIAHRLSTIMHADKIFVLEKGKIIESGKHAQLIDQKGLYYAMWRQQIGER